ncbi:MAG: beta-Ala-His dipeptidase [Candidatus Eisenbacteria bacterium]|nr:beta-Ala-His dipeptidase [Candidatus Eisenbacteria bacterium]
MAQSIDELEPRTLWHYFLELSKIPRCSKQEQAAIEWIARIAAAHGAETQRDATGNLLVRIPASKGYEQAPTVALQGHIDMVCEKNADTRHDFSQDPILPVIDGEWVTAEGTTLGADNGIGVAAGLAFLDSPDCVHGPLELLVTVDEETGLTGAFGIEPGFLSADYLINLDSEEIGIFTVGCAGGTDTQIRFRAPRSPAPDAELLRVTVTGLQGGHSGTDIHKNRGNSIKLLLRILAAALDDPNLGALRLGPASGGSKRNAIPREASALLAVPAGKGHAFHAAIESTRDRIRTQLAGVDEGFALRIEDAQSGEAGFCDADASARMIRMVRALPAGVAAMNVEIPDLVETSNNVGVLTDRGDGYEIVCATRSSLAPALRDLLGQLRAVAALAGAEAEHADGYPGWKPNLQSPLLARAREVHQRIFDRPAEVQAIHAGLECGLFTEKYPELDIISYGPDIEGAHSPDERVRIETVQRMWAFTCALLEDLARRQP